VPIDEAEDRRDSSLEPTRPLGPGLNRRNRGGRVKKRKQHEIRDHKFTSCFFRQPTCCSFCKEFLWGFTEQGYQCNLCGLTVHKKCHVKILSNCPGSAKALAEQEQPNDPAQHRLNFNAQSRAQTYSTHSL
jgi:hypothetical protein